MRGGELQQEIVFILGKDVLDGIFPTLEHLPLGLRSSRNVHVMGFIGNQHNPVLAEVFKSDGIFFFSGQIGV